MVRPVVALKKWTDRDRQHLRSHVAQGTAGDFGMSGLAALGEQPMAHLSQITNQYIFKYVFMPMIDNKVKQI